MVQPSKEKNVAEILKKKGATIIFASRQNGMIICHDRPPADVRSYSGVLGGLEGSEETARRLLSMEEKKEEKPAVVSPITPGEAVIVIAGSYKGFAGIARQMTGDGKVLVHLSIYGKGVPVRLAPEDLKKEEMGELWR